MLSEIHEYDIDLENNIIYFGHKKDQECSINPDSAAKFIKNIDILSGANNNITVKFICIDGGCWCSAIAMYNSVLRLRNHVAVIASGYLLSGGPFVLQAADVRYLEGGIEFMIHDGSISLEGNSSSVISYMKFKENISYNMVSVFSARCQYGKFFINKKYSINQVKQYINRQIKKKGDWYLSAEEAVYYGFADEVI